MIIYSEETCKDASLTASNYSVNYPPTNLLDSRLTRIFRSTGTSVNIVFDNLSAVSVDSILIARHNLTSSATVTLEGNATDVWTSPSVSESVTYDAGIMRKSFTTASYRYWRLVISDGTNPDGYIQIGRAWIGADYTTPKIGMTVTEVRNTRDVKTKSISGQTYGDKRYNFSQFITTWPLVTHTQKSELITIFNTFTNNTPFFIEFDSTC